MQAFLNGRFPKGVLCIRQQHEGAARQRKKTADGGWRVEDGAACFGMNAGHDGVDSVDFDAAPDGACFNEERDLL